MYFIAVDIYIQLVILMVDPLMVRERFQVILIPLNKIYGKPWCVVNPICCYLDNNLYVYFRRGYT